MINTANLTLRQPVASDWDAFHAFYQSPRSETLRGEDDSLGKAWRVFAAELGHWAIRGYGMFAVTKNSDDTALGLIGPWAPEDWPEQELAWMMFTGEGKGIAFEAATAARDYAFSTLNWQTAVSYIDADNLRSIKLAERLGATRDDNAPLPANKTCLVYRHHKGAIQ